MVSRDGKKLLSNLIRHTGSHNRRVEEEQMWQQHEASKRSNQLERVGTGQWRDSPHRRLLDRMADSMDSREVSPPRRLNRRAHMDEEDGRTTESTFWMRQLQKFEEKDPDRWGHAGYKEMYPDEFASDRSDDEGSRKRSRSGERRKKEGKKKKKKHKHRHKSREKRHREKNSSSHKKELGSKKERKNDETDSSEDSIDSYTRKANKRKHRSSGRKDTSDLVDKRKRRFSPSKERCSNMNGTLHKLESQSNKDKKYYETDSSDSDNLYSRRDRKWRDRSPDRKDLRDAVVEKKDTRRRNSDTEKYSEMHGSLHRMKSGSKKEKRHYETDSSENSHCDRSNSRKTRKRRHRSPKSNDSSDAIKRKNKNRHHINDACLSEGSSVENEQLQRKQKPRPTFFEAEAGLSEVQMQESSTSIHNSREKSQEQKRSRSRSSGLSTVQQKGHRNKCYSFCNSSDSQSDTRDIHRRKHSKDSLKKYKSKSKNTAKHPHDTSDNESD
ncbi:uncharacterized protein NKAPD1-like [Lingula anatina]|uniref:Uncharacterized protein NKAPD1-like n=1 Tax=Lingula anatina TaxID=7574 RepID=A0A1S3IGP2_LINAN|nr:uncharacterized protein NKAPD1-like [Lingula anatina]|eukprot:XP_013397387.1 uncharacterized protein NKAPD1-like [Lingula anatina]